MFGIKQIFNKIEERVNKLEDEALGEEIDGFFGSHYISGGLKEDMKEIREDFKELNKRFNALLKHFKIEYHEITDKNGSTIVKEVFKKIKKKKVKDSDYED